MALNDGEHKLQNNKKTQHALCNFLVGDPYGIRTHECMRERHVS